MIALSPSHQLTVLFSIYQNDTWTIRHLVDETINPATQRIILKIARFQNPKPKTIAFSILKLNLQLHLEYIFTQKTAVIHYDLL